MSRKQLAIWALTPKAAALSDQIAGYLKGADRFHSCRLGRPKSGARVFDHLSAALAQEFGQYQGHVFIMAAGIVVRAIAGLIVNKTRDPAVVVLDEAGRYAISLLSGHIGGANSLAADVARITGGKPVITTATDVNHLPAIDVLAGQKGLAIENPSAIKAVHMALLSHRPVGLHDPHHLLSEVIWPPNVVAKVMSDLPDENFTGIFIDDIRMQLPDPVLVLRPRTLAVGIGCNRNTAMPEMMDFLFKVLDDFGLSRNSLSAMATVDLKADEPGLLSLSRALSLDLRFFNRAELNLVPNIATPSIMVEKHLGVKSVCEAAAILGAGSGRLIVPKQKSGNVTLAIARRVFTS